MIGENSNPIAELVQSLTDAALEIQDVDFENLSQTQQLKLRHVAGVLQRWQASEHFPTKPAHPMIVLKDRAIRAKAQFLRQLGVSYAAG